MSIDIIANENNQNLPWTFRLPYRGEKKANNEPTNHQNGIRKLTHTEFEIPLHKDEKEFKTHFKGCENIDFKNGQRNHLTLEFDNKSQKKEMEFEELNLTIKY